MYCKEYRIAAANAAGLVDEDGKPVHFTVTTQKDRVANATAPAVYHYIEGTMRTAWEPSEFIGVEEWLERQQSAPEAEAVAEKGHAADQPQPEKGHAAD